VIDHYLIRSVSLGVLRYSTKLRKKGNFMSHSAFWDFAESTIFQCKFTHKKRFD